jgi:hypothetical protein
MEIYSESFIFFSYNIIMTVTTSQSALVILDHTVVAFFWDFKLQDIAASLPFHVSPVFRSPYQTGGVAERM